MTISASRSNIYGRPNKEATPCALALQTLCMNRMDERCGGSRSQITL